MKRASSTLTEPPESAPCRSSLFPGCLLHAEAELRPTKLFKEAIFKTDKLEPAASPSSAVVSLLTLLLGRILLSSSG
jgi:hypothetical protein